MRAAVATVVLLSAVAWAAPPEPPPELRKKARLVPFARGLDAPLYLAHAPGDPPDRLYVVEKTGRIRVLEGGSVANVVLLDLSRRVSRGAEQGLLGLAFHPRFAENRRLFVNFTDKKGDTHVVEYRADPPPAVRVDPKSERELLTIAQPWANHNGGHLAFGPDGKLYVGTGDGGSGYDPKGNGQDPKALLGKMLRLDVDAPAPRPEIHMIGLRNPWRYAFDAKTGDLYIADVGQDRWEEVHVVAAQAARKGGQNFGWSVLEGAHCLRGGTCNKEGLLLPEVEYDHKVGCSITGGAVYRGKKLPALDGVYFYADYCTAALRGFRWKDGRVVDHWDWKRALDPGAQLAQVASFGVDAAGELYVLSLDGTIYRLEPL